MLQLSLAISLRKKAGEGRTLTSYWLHVVEMWSTEK